MAFGEEHLKELIRVAIKNNASDIHIRESEKPCFRIKGILAPIKTQDFEHSDMLSLCSLFLGENTNIETLREKDGSYEIDGLCRLRFNIMKFNKKIAIILRLIKLEIPSIDDLSLPSSLKNIALNSKGLILVTGATGSGKSTTLSAMIDHINKNKRFHIVTLEDPIEYLYPQIKSRISQREIGQDTTDFITAFKYALRQDPDIISIGEMRDAETASIALKAAETGHTIFSTIHTTDALSTIGRLIAMFPPKEQENVRKRIADNLFATISQKLLNRKTDDSFVPAIEIMINTPGIRECILGKEDIREVYTYIEKGHGQSGSQSFDQHISELLKNNIISQEIAIEASSSSSDFAKKLTFK